MTKARGARAPKGIPPAHLFFQRVEVDPHGCWIWRGARFQNGRGAFNVRGDKLWLAHRFSYTVTRGPIPDGLVLDHLCRNPPCVNPWHLEPVTTWENIHRGIGNPSKTHCPKGHPYSGDNLWLYRGGRRCRECAREKGRQNYAEHPERIRNYQAKQRAKLEAERRVERAKQAAEEAFAFEAKLKYYLTDGLPPRVSLESDDSPFIHNKRARPFTKLSKILNLDLRYSAPHDSQSAC